VPDRKDLIVIASAKAKPGSGEELERALREVAKPTRVQTGCVRFSLYRSVEDPSIILGFERWASREDHQRHLQEVVTVIIRNGTGQSSLGN
jgi:quinol monooxygenase YgiN